MPQQIAATEFVDQLFLLCDEILGIPEQETGPTRVLDLNTGWAQSLAAVDAEEASRPIAPGGTSIAAHTAPAAYYLELFEAIVDGGRQQSDWQGSFRPAEVDAVAWARHNERLFGVAARVGELVRANPRWEPEQLGGVMGNLTHLACRLGAVRQMLRVVKG